MWHVIGEFQGHLRRIGLDHSPIPGAGPFRATAAQASRDHATLLTQQWHHLAPECT